MGAGGRLRGEEHSAPHTTTRRRRPGLLCFEGEPLPAVYIGPANPLSSGHRNTPCPFGRSTKNSNFFSWEPLDPFGGQPPAPYCGVRNCEVPPRGGSFPRTALSMKGDNQEVFPIKRIVAACCVVVAIATTSQSVVRAGEVVTPMPVIDEHPRVVDYLSDAKISGQVRDGDPAKTVHLQRQKANQEGWRSIASETLGRDRAIAFTLRGLKETARYRLRYGTERSDAVRINVKPRLTLNISPDHVMSGNQMTLRGVLYPKVRGRTARLQWKVDGAWRTIERVSVGDGEYRVPLRSPAPGHRRVRITFSQDARNGWARRTDRSHSYERSLATWYGPGFYGNHTACGPVLQRDSIGVAHRVLPCGTKVEILYRGRTVTVPVIDRGPYGDSNWDLTQRTAEKINFSGKEYIGVLH